MPMLPPSVSFPEPDTYTKYWDVDLRGWRYLHLVERDAPLYYPRRISSVAPGSKTGLITFDELDPSETKHHVYNLYLGVYPNTLVHLWHPYNVKQLTFDERISQIDENLAATLDYKSSPHDAPRKSVWVTFERYPGVEVRNIGPLTAVMRVLWVGAKYRVLYDEEISSDEKNRLADGTIPSLPITVGGEW